MAESGHYGAPVHARAIQTTSLLITLLFPSAMLAQSSGAGGQDNSWVPSFSLFGGILTQKAEASSSSNARPSTQGDAELTYPLVGFSAELMTPKLSGWRGSPALFLHGDVAMSFSSTWKVAAEGSSGPPELPTVQGLDLALLAPEDVIGTGTQTTAEAEPLELSAGVGIAFEIKLWDRTLRLRPSFEYRREQISYALALSNVATYLPPTPGGFSVCGPDLNGDPLKNGCGFASLSMGQKETVHSIGPGFEVALDAGRAGPFILTLYASAQAYHVLGSRSTTIDLTGSYDPPPPSPDPIQATTTIERDPWNYRGLVGLRFRWLPQ